MSDLKRITTQFIEDEDRIRLSGEVELNQTMTLWLTRRLMSRLVSHLVAWLDTQTLTQTRPEVMQEFAQGAARASLTPQAPVQASPLDTAWLVTSVDLTSNAQVVLLTFKGAVPEQLARLSFETIQLRQWLSIVFNQYRQAEWPLDLWPDWIKGEGLGAGRQSEVFLH